LFGRYKSEQQGIRANRSQEWKDARAKRDRLIADVKRKATLKRATTQLAGGSRSEKKLLYAMTSQSVKGELNKIKKQYRRECERLLKQYQPLQWADWLRREATQGNKDALEALRARVVALGLQGNTVSARGGELKRTGVKADQDSLTKKGTIIYSVGASAVRDDGDRLKVSRGAKREGLEAALRLAMERYGTNITVNGTADFKAQLVEVAATFNLEITFADSALERQRRALMSTASSITQDYKSADQYIQEREQKRNNNFDILTLRRYNDSDAGVLAFTGLRRIDDKPLALLQRDNEILLMPVDEKTAKRLSRLSINSLVTCGGMGVIKLKGRSQ